MNPVEISLFILLTALILGFYIRDHRHGITQSPRQVLLNAVTVISQLFAVVIGLVGVALVGAVVVLAPGLAGTILIFALFGIIGANGENSHNNRYATRDEQLAYFDRHDLPYGPD